MLLLPAIPLTSVLQVVTETVRPTQYGVPESRHPYLVHQKDHCMGRYSPCRLATPCCIVLICSPMNS
jgi:hypothetical protein